MQWTNIKDQLKCLRATAAGKCHSTVLWSLMCIIILAGHELVINQVYTSAPDARAERGNTGLELLSKTTLKH